MNSIENGMRPIHPGEVLREEFMIPLGLSANALAASLQVPAPRINDVARERRAVTADTALRLARFFGTSAEFWMGLQVDYDTARAREKLADALSRIQRFDVSPNHFGSPALTR
ncbi:MAG: HigA family addiction module antidote protein [Candidatus Accumulibacter sp.]|jgi:addiction module HigA family antidote|nr:HigA family addiction module antidote protein [Accumulibacter sp.]